MPSPSYQAGTRYIRTCRSKATTLVQIHQKGQILYMTTNQYWTRIRMFLDLPDPDPLVRGINPDLAPDPSR
jgi:hypothetical protein